LDAYVVRARLTNVWALFEKCVEPTHGIKMKGQMNLTHWRKKQQFFRVFT